MKVYILKLSKSLRYCTRNFSDYHDIMSKNILITGGAGFIGTNLCNKLTKEGNKVYCLDNLSSSKKFPQNVIKHFEDVKEVNKYAFDELDEIYHLACPASPPRYQKNPIDTMMTNVLGTKNILEIAKYNKCKILLTSTSEIYGNPTVHPQVETYRGNVNPIGPRSCYDEGKRAAECLMYDYQRMYGIDIRVARIFNTYGPHMDLEDGRVVTNFIRQILKGEDITIYGNGSQTRSFCYVSDMVNGLIKLMDSNYTQPVNLGNPNEITINQLFQKLIHRPLLLREGASCDAICLNLPQDDPERRKPDISLAKKILKWRPRVSLEDGLKRTIVYAKKELGYSLT